MRLAVYLPLVLPALFAPLAGPLSAWLEPRRATWVLTLSAAVLAGCSTLALALLAADALVRVSLIASLDHWSLRVLGPGTTAAAVVAAAAGLRPTVRSRRMA